MKKIFVLILLLSTLLVAKEEQKNFQQISYKSAEWINLNKKIISLLQQGDNFFNLGNYAQAVKTYQEILDLNPHDQKTKLLWQRSKKAQDLARKIQEAYSGCSYRLVLENIALLNKINPLDNNYNNYKINAEQIENLTAKGDSLFKAAKYNEAIITYERVIKINSADSIVPAKISLTHDLLDKHKQATQYYLTGKYLQAKQIFQDILLQNPNDLQANESIVKCNKIIENIAQADNCFHQNDFQKALNYLNEVNNINPEDQDILKRTLDYKYIVDYYENNNLLLQNSFYKEVIYNYKKMLAILPDNQILRQELQKYEQCLTAKNKAVEYYTSENYREALENYQKILNVNPEDLIISHNYKTAQQAINLQNQAQNAFNQGNYALSLNLFKKINDFKIEQEKTHGADWSFYRGQENTADLELKNSEISEIGIVFAKDLKARMNNLSPNHWQAKIFFPAGFLNGYNIAKVYVHDQKGRKNLVYLPYLIEDKIVLSPAGYVENEKDLAL